MCLMGTLAFPLQTMAQQNAKFIGSKTKNKVTTIAVNADRQECNIMHITDSHITLEDAEGDAKVWQYCKRMHGAYKNTDEHPCKENITRAEAFRMLMDVAKTKKVDFVVLGGDMVNFPSPKTVDFIHKVMEESGIPYVYTAGNHDWHLEGTPGSDDEKRESCLPILKPLYQGRNPLYSSDIVKGVNVVCIDNSTYQINKEQLDFFKEQVKRGYPIVLCIHIPVCTTMHQHCTMGNPKWGPEIDDSYKLEGRQQWSKEGNRPETMEFYNMLMTTPNIVVITGHVHREREEHQGQLFQLVTDMGRKGHYRIIRFVGQNQPEDKD